MSAAAEILRDAHARYRDAIGTERERIEYARLEVVTKLIAVAERAKRGETSREGKEST